jgi:uncharacterized protein YndB with AHSA1/START domain
METERIERETSVAADPEDVWEALTDAPSLSEWFGASAEIDARPGGKAVFRWPDGSERAAVVEEADAPRRLAFRWLPFERMADGDVVELPATRVEITIEPDGEGSRLRVVETLAFSSRGAFVLARGGILVSA